ncbi:leucine-rich repeat domain-containing protein [Promethearchaeum syntrophicum]|uniref:Leucine-rich repeat domain-containing protein n=1 Tax=Promethearchaeum syntrophicum TaxID=2594042 RepID=A0A5B9D6L3_9ARCH|nr:leucine-rich repeat domain-containing protein [Candidatus Prometheoarchaeum syntrophicum]
MENKEKNAVLKIHRNQSEELMNYNGQALVKSNVEVLIELEHLIGKPASYRVVDYNIVALGIRGHLKNNFNRIDKLPENIGNLTNLEYLTIENQNISELPPSFSKLTNLIRIHIDSIKLKSIDLPFQHFSKLQILYITYCGLSELPMNIEKIPNLKKLSLNGNPIKTIPKRLGKLLSLNELTISECSISTLPKTLKNLTDLSKLVIFKNRFESIPDFISIFPNLIKLSFFDNPLRSLSNIPQKFIAEFIKSYKNDSSDLFLSPTGSKLFNSGDIKGLLQYYQKSPQKLAKQFLNDFNSLTGEDRNRLLWEASTSELQLFRSKLQNLAEFSTFNVKKNFHQYHKSASPNLIIKFINTIERRIQKEREIQKQYSKYKNKPILKNQADFIRKLEEKYDKSFSLQAGTTNSIKISHGQITQLNLTKLPIPENIDTLTSLTSISIINPIPTKIPPSINKLTQLKEIYLSRLNESEIKKIKFQKFSKLETLHIEECKINRLPPSIKYLKNLTSLLFTNTNLSILPKWLGSLTNIEGLVCYGNNFQFMPESMKNLKNLTEIDIGGGNQFEIIPDFIASLQKLQILSIWGLPLRSLSNIPKNIFDYTVWEGIKEEALNIDNLTPKGKNLIEHYQHGNPEELYNYYRKSPSQLAQQYSDNLKSLTSDEEERLGWEAGHREREILELKLPPNDPILAKINKRLSISLKNGLKIMK